jgi:hypothetical protein
MPRWSTRCRSRRAVPRPDGSCREVSRHTTKSHQCHLPGSGGGRVAAGPLAGHWGDSEQSRYRVDVIQGDHMDVPSCSRALSKADIRVTR